MSPTGSCTSCADIQELYAIESANELKGVLNGIAHFEARGSLVLPPPWLHAPQQSSPVTGARTNRYFLCKVCQSAFLLKFDPNTNRGEWRKLGDSPRFCEAPEREKQVLGRLSQEVQGRELEFLDEQGRKVRLSICDVHADFKDRSFEARLDLTSPSELYVPEQYSPDRPDEGLSTGRHFKDSPRVVAIPALREWLKEVADTIRSYLNELGWNRGAEIVFDASERIHKAGSDYYL